MYLDNLEKVSCSGCGACKNICPRNAIVMKMDEKGFWYPEIDEEKCIHCNLCKRVCPQCDKPELSLPIKIYACKNKSEEIRSTSSSGGVFTEISKVIFEDDGIVAGAVMSKSCKVEHQIATNVDELEAIKKSKYVQSDVKDVYKLAKAEVMAGRKTLFSGTPCQVKAFKNMLIQEKDNAYTVDVVCHGTPSPGVYESYKEYLEKKYNSKIINVNFRHKNDESTQNIKVDFENGESYISNRARGDLFYNLFLKDIILRDSCYNCPFKSFERGGDISLADFWGYEKGAAKDFGDNKGISLVLVNTEKGLELFDKIKDKIDYMEVTRDMCENYNCFRNFNGPDNANEIWQKYIENGIESVIDLLK